MLYIRLVLKKEDGLQVEMFHFFTFNEFGKFYKKEKSVSTHEYEVMCLD